MSRYLAWIALTWITLGTVWAGDPYALTSGKVGIEEKLGGKIPLDLFFQDETGKKVQLKDYFSQGKPVVLSLVYYSCPSLCNLVLNGLLDTLKKTPWTPGKQFQIVTVSIDPKEDHVIASKKKETYIKQLGKPEAAMGWHFLTGDQKSIHALADAVGFRYTYDEKTKEYAHASAINVLTPAGVLSRYFYGVSFFERDFRFSLLEASNGKVGNVIERLLMLCYRYDPELRGYALLATRMIQVGAIAMTLIVGVFMTSFWMRQRKC